MYMSSYVKLAYVVDWQGDFMIYPCLVPECICKTPINVIIYGEGLDENGGPEVVFESDPDLRCNYQDNAKTVLTAEQKIVQLSGTALFRGDIAPGVPVISDGQVIVDGVTRKIFQGLKARNVDGTVNYTRIDVV